MSTEYASDQREGTTPSLARGGTVGFVSGPNGGDGTTSDAAELLARHREVLPAWLALYYREPIELVRGEGARVWDSAGREYLDFFGGIVTTISCHANPPLVQAMRDQAGRLVHTSTLYLIRSMVELAER